ncbi:CopM family metallochaperone [Paraburkholderia sediminicola]|uniref:CopM family metallochaperone n=1 Tax=Paraburkholderia sediminicola TaxID=458836 RepID=UPI0038B7D409
MKSLLALRAASICAGLVLTVAAYPASAQQGASMPGMNMSSSADSGSSPSISAFKEADEKMMKEMSAPPYSGDTDKDFVSHMTPHHQGAIDMAKVELKYGKDPDMKRLARNIIKAQNEEIAYMKKWQAKHAGK